MHNIYNSYSTQFKICSVICNILHVYVTFQRGNLTYHLTQVEAQVETGLKPGFDGVAVIDMENWRPLFEHNFDSLSMYQKMSIDIVKARYPYLNNTAARKEAAREFDTGARYLKNNNNDNNNKNTCWAPHLNIQITIQEPGTYFFGFMNTCLAPHLDMSLKHFTMATIVLFSSSEQAHCVVVI